MRLATPFDPNRNRRDRQLRFRFYHGYGFSDDSFDDLDLRAGAISDCQRSGTPSDGRVLKLNPTILCEPPGP